MRCRAMGHSGYNSRAAWAASAFGQQQQAFMIQTTRLRNGVTVVSRALPERHSAALGVWLLNGTRYEAAHESGYAHLLEQLLFKGTPELAAVTLACRFDAMVPGAELHELLQRFIAMLRTPRFNDDELAVETKVVFQEMAMVQDSPEETLEEVGVARAWTDHPQ